ncbi:hypothetical protein [Streptomyces sp. NPDC001820]|uniref:hypothetical protein n=1 Tax=Streptomyces sp. NPDC001820 TaxID=3364613 RepID=UPI003694E8AB
MTAIQLIASFVATGRLHGVGIGSTLSEVDQAIRSDFIDVVDESGLSLRRDYGFVEFYFNPGPEWVMSGGSIELHRLASGYERAEKWRQNMNVHYPQYLTWKELREELSRIPDLPPLTVKDQGGFLEYRAAATKVSVIVNDDHEERDDWVGHGDVWSVSLG